MDRPIKAPTTIEDGLHKGVISAIEERKTKEDYKYIDLVLDFEKGKRVKASYADFISQDSQLGHLLVRFGCDLSKVGGIINLEEHLLKKTCQFQTIKKGKFSNVIIESVRPVE